MALRAFVLPTPLALGCLLVGYAVGSGILVIAALVWHQSDSLLLYGLFFCVAFGLILYARSHREAPPAPLAGSHGSARWGDPRDLIGPRGLILGRAGRHLLRYEGEGHVLTVAPTGSGKGVSAVIPNLLAYPGSVVVVDLKGENYAVTAARRRQAGDVVILDPFALRERESAAFNPLSLIDPESDLCDADAATLAYLLVLPATEGDAVFWDEEAAALLSGLILYVAAHEEPERQHLGTVRAHLTASPADWADLLTRMESSEKAHGLIARAAHRLRQKADRERSGVVSTAQRHTHFLDSPAILRTLDHSSFHLAQLKGPKPLSLYLVMPPERLGSHGRWLRLIAGSAIQAMLRTPNRGPERVLFLLDEFAQLGRLQPATSHPRRGDAPRPLGGASLPLGPRPVPRWARGLPHRPSVSRSLCTESHAPGGVTCPDSCKTSPRPRSRKRLSCSLRSSEPTTFPSSTFRNSPGRQW